MLKVNQIKFVVGKKESPFDNEIIYIDPLVRRRSDNSILSIVSRIRKNFHVKNELIHYIGLIGIHYRVILKCGSDLQEHTLPIRKSKDQLVLMAMTLMSKDNEDFNEIRPFAIKVIMANSIIKKKVRIFKSYKFYYKLLISEVDQESLDKFSYLYDINKKLDIGSYSKLASKLSHWMDQYGSNYNGKE